MLKCFPLDLTHSCWMTTWLQQFVWFWQSPKAKGLGSVRRCSDRHQWTPLSQTAKVGWSCPRPPALPVRSHLQSWAGEYDQPFKPVALQAHTSSQRDWIRLWGMSYPCFTCAAKKVLLRPAISYLLGASAEKCDGLPPRNAQICLENRGKCEVFQRCHHALIKCGCWDHKRQVTSQSSLMSHLPAATVSLPLLFKWRVKCLWCFSATHPSIIYHLVFWCQN